MAKTSSGLENFLADIRPFFSRHRVVYVDVGAFTGEVCEKVLASRMQVGEVHLIEPNASSMASARERVASIFKGHSVNYYEVALGARAGRVKVHPAKSMTKIVSIVSDENAPSEDANTFEVDCATLDSLASNFTEGRISLLKIDVEGFEIEVLSGAENLLRNELVDVLYIEAGMDPNGTQQTYYRGIEDLMRQYGYRLFRIYEQHHEWLQDSPLLRRVNLAFMSRKFAEQNPYRLTNELHEVTERLTSSQQKLVDANQRIAELDEAAKAATAAIAAAEARAQAAAEEQATADRALAAISETNRNLIAECDAVLAERDQLIATRENLVAERATLINDRDTARKKRNSLIEERDTLIAERTALIAERDTAVSARDSLTLERDALAARCTTLSAERDNLASSQTLLLSERDDLLSLRQALTAERDTLLAERHDIQTEKESLKKKKTSLTEERDALRQQTAALGTQRDGLIAERGALITERDSLIVEKTALAGERHSLAAERGTLAASLNVLTAERDSLLGERSSLTAERDTLLASRNSLSAERTELLAARTALTSERDSLLGKRKSLIAERDALLVTRDNLSSERTTLQAAQSTLTAERDSLLGERSSLAAERDALLAIRDNLSVERSALQTAKNSLVSERDSLLSERTTLIAERDALLAARNNLSSERDALLIAQTTLTLERDSLLGERTSLIAERDTLLASRNSLSAERMVLLHTQDALTAERDALLTERGYLVADRDALLENRNSLSVERTTLLSAKTALTAERDALLAERSSLIVEHDTLLAARASLSDERDALLASRNALTSERDSLLDTSSSLITERAMLLASRDSIAAERGALIAERNGLLTQRSALETERDGLIVVRRELTADCAEAAQALATAKDAVLRLTREQEAALRESAEQTGRNRKLQGSHDKLTQQCKTLERKLGALQTAAAETSSKLASVTRERDSLSRDVTTLTHNKEQLLRDCKQLQAAQTELQQALDHERKDLAARQGANRNLQRRLRDVLDAVPQLHRRELRAWSEVASARAEAALIRDGLAHRLGEVTLERTKVAKGWLTLPLHLRKVRDTQAVGSLNATAVSVDPPAIEFVAGKLSVFLPLTLKAQRVRLPNVQRDYEVVIHCLSWDAKSAAVVEAALTHPQNNSPVINLQIARLRTDSVAAAYSVPLQQDHPVSFMHLAAGSDGVALDLRRIGGSFCVIKVELREPRVESQRGHKDRPRRKRNKVVQSVVSPPVAESTRESDTTVVAMPSASVTLLKSVVEPSVAAPRAELILAKETPKTFSAEDLEKKLWGGFSHHAIPELERIKLDRKATKAERAAAAWNLARWFFVDADFSQTLENTLFAKSHAKQPRREFLLTEVQCLIGLGRHQEADALIDDCIKNNASPNPDFLLLKSTVKKNLVRDANGTTAEAEEVQLRTLNEHLQRVGMAPIQKKDPSQPLVMSNLLAHAEPKQRQQTQKVSILMPAFNAETTIEWAIEGLLQQTWKNLEIIVVDDVSTDSTCDRVARIAERDPRVRLIRKPVNEGPYRSRNEGLKHATGDLITVHDSDDWSHPQKLEIQIKTLETNKKAVACLSYWVRVTNTLEIVGAWLPKGSLYDINLSSLLFRRSLLDTIDSWDDVRVGADAEFHSRLLAIYGKEAVPRVPQEYLLSLALTRENSLTRTEATHLRSLFYGVRRSYRDSYRLWHDKLTKSGTKENLSGKNQFPIPLGNTPQRAGKRQSYDVIVIADFVLLGGAFVSTLNYIVAACNAGKRVAVFHWRKYELSAYSQLNPRLYDACTKYGIDLLSAGDIADTELVLFGYPAILQHRIDPMPTISTKEVIVIINQFASRLVDGGDPQYDPRVARSNVLSMFGTEGVWVPISAWVQRLMREDKRYPTPYETPWLPMIDTKTWCKAVARWRGPERKVPVVGRHGRDAYTKWPARIDSLRQAYGVDAQWDVRFLGGAAHAVKELGEQPKNWTIVPFDGISVYDFLADLDFFVHYPHEEYIEEFGRAVMEAMAVGVPVILPPQFKETFGEAALYAAPADVQTTIARLWSSRKAYMARSAAGRQFVLKNCDIGGFNDRLAALRSFTDTSRVATRVA